MIYLTPDSLGCYLVQRGILSNRDFVAESWCLRSVDSLRPVMEARRPDGSGWIVKQPARLVPSEIYALDREAALYEFARLSRAAGDLKRFVPRLRNYDRGVHALVIERLPYENGWTQLRQPAADPAACARAIAAALAATHLPLPASAAEGRFLRLEPPWILRAAATRVDREDNPAAQRAMEAIRSDPLLLRMLSEIEADWTPDALIHGDSKLENALLRPAPGARCWLIDWGMASRGEPAWDVAGMIQSAISLWFNGMTFEEGMEFEAVIARGSIPFSRIQSFVAALVDRYCKLRPQDPDFLHRSFRMAGARLVQTCFEHARTTKALMRRHVAMLRLARSALEDPTGMVAEFAPAARR